jgi:hypothetical protein
MDTYRDDYAAAREQVDALKLEIAETKRSLEEAHALVRVHETSTKTLEARLKQTKPTRVRLLFGLLCGLAFGFLFGVTIGDQRAKDSQAIKTWEAMKKCQDDAWNARMACDAEIDHLKSVFPNGRFSF